MPSRKSRSRSRSPHKRHKKSHKKSKRTRSKSRNSPASPVNSLKFEEKSNSNDSNNSNGIYKPKLPSVMLPPAFLAKLEPKEEPKQLERNEPASVVETSSPSSNINPVATNGQPERKRKSRWAGDENEKVFLPNMPTTISMTAMTEEQRKIYLLKLQIEELTRRLKINDLGIPLRVADRSPSPEPIYDQQGKRQNTREVRTRKRIEEQRHQLVTELLLIDPEYKAPGDYKPQQVKVIEKVMIPQEDHPDVNFVGLIIGPRGSTLKMLEKETGAKIIIRGKGSVKDGKMGLVRHAPMPGEDEPLHAYITGATQEMVSKAAEKVQEIINKSIDAPEGLNELRKQQLRQLALLNGTLRENEPLMKMKLMEEDEKIVTNTIICPICGGAGHVQADCKFRRNPDGSFVDPSVDSSFMINSNPQEKQKLDCEYQSLINELSGNKDTESSLSLADRRNLSSGTKLGGPTLAISGGQPLSTTNVDSKPGVTGSASSSFNLNGPRSQEYDQTRFSSNFNSFNSSNSMGSASNNNMSISSASTSYPSATTFGNTGPRYNNNEVFDGYHLLRRHTRPTNYSSYIEGDSYRAQHIPALLESGGSSMNHTNNSNSSYSQQSYYSNQSWKSYNSSSYYQSAYQQQYFQSSNTSFVPPLPKGPPPPPPPPL